MEKKRKKRFIAILCSVLAVLTVAMIPLAIYGCLAGGLLFLNKKTDRVAREVIQPKAEAYIAQTYPGNDFVIDKAYYAFKSNCYRVELHSQSSKDTYFEIDYDYKTYELRHDSYESWVTGGYNTRVRVETSYAEQVEACLGSIAYRVDSRYCSFSETASSSLQFSPEGLDEKTLILDHDYDAAALGSAYGYVELTVIVPEEKINLEGAYELLMEADRLLADSGIGYYVMEITLKDAAYPDTATEYNLYAVQPKDLQQEDALTHLQEMWQTQENRRQAVKAQQENDETNH